MQTGSRSHQDTGHFSWPVTSRHRALQWAGHIKTQGTSVGRSHQDTGHFSGPVTSRHRALQWAGHIKTQGTSVGRSHQDTGHFSGPVTSRHRALQWAGHIKTQGTSVAHRVGVCLIDSHQWATEGFSYIRISNKDITVNKNVLHL